MQKHRARLQALSERFDEAHAHVASTTWLSPTKERLHHTHCDVQKKLQTSSDSSRPRERVRSSSLPHVASSVSAAEATREAEIPKTLRKSSLSSSTGSASPSHVLARGAAVNLEVRASSAGAGASADADIDRSDENCSGVETASRDTDVGEEDRHQHYLKRNTGSIGVKATFHHSMLCDLGGEMVKAGEEAMMVKPIEYEQEQGTGTIDRIVVEGKEKPGRHTEMKERYACNEKEQSAQGREVLEKVGEIRRAFTLIQRAFKSMDVHRTGEEFPCMGTLDALRAIGICYLGDNESIGCIDIRCSLLLLVCSVFLHSIQMNVIYIYPVQRMCTVQSFMVVFILMFK